MKGIITNAEVNSGVVDVSSFGELRREFVPGRTTAILTIIVTEGFEEIDKLMRGEVRISPSKGVSLLKEAVSPIKVPKSEKVLPRRLMQI